MTHRETRTRNCLIDDIKCLETQLSALQLRFDIIVNWIRSQYFELNGLPHFVIVAVRGDKGSIEEKLETTRETLVTIEHVKLECDNFDDTVDVNISFKIESDDQSEKSVDVLKGNVFENESSKFAVGDRQLIEAEEDSGTDEPPAERTTRSNNWNASKGDTKKCVRKVPLQRGKGLILTASEYEEMVAPLPPQRLACAICANEYPSSARRRRHEIEVHLTKDEGLIVRTNLLKAFKESTMKKCDAKINVQKTSEHLQVNIEKGLILTAFEYKEKIATLPKDRLSCAICPKVFQSSSSLKRHELEVHLTTAEKLLFRNCMSKKLEVNEDVATMCDICNLPFKNIESHKKNHLPPGVVTTVEGRHRPHYRCLKCDSVFQKKTEYLTHVTTECKVEETIDNSNDDQRTDEQPTERTFLCNYCGQSFNRKYTLQVHELAVHANKRDFKCKFCDKRFVIEYRKKCHEKKHLGTSTVTCDLCGYSFRGKQILRKHIRGVHENRRPHKCRLCDKSFKTSTARNYHLNTHGNPNGRQRALNRDSDPIHAAAKRRRCMALNLTTT